MDYEFPNPDFTKKGKFHDKPATKIHPTIGRMMEPEEAVKLRVRRINLYALWLDAYLDKLMSTFARELEDFAVKGTENWIYQAVYEMVGINDHRSCPDDCCFGPKDQDLRMTRLPLKGFSNEIAKKIKEAVKIAKKPPAPKKVRLPVDDDDHEDPDVVAEFGGVTKDYTVNWISTITPTATTDLAGWWGGSVGFPALGEVLGLAISEGAKSYAINYPLYKRVGRLRKLLADKGVADVDQEIYADARKGNADRMLKRCLAKVQREYPKRIADRHRKLRKVMSQIERRDKNAGKDAGRLVSCKEAETLLRYYFKLLKYHEKAVIHILIVRAGVDEIRARIERKAKAGYSKFWYQNYDISDHFVHSFEQRMKLVEEDEVP